MYYNGVLEQETETQIANLHADLLRRSSNACAFGG